MKAAAKTNKNLVVAWSLSVRTRSLIHTTIRRFRVEDEGTRPRRPCVRVRFTGPGMALLAFRAQFQKRTTAGFVGVYPHEYYPQEYAGTCQFLMRAQRNARGTVRKLLVIAPYVYPLVVRTVYTDQQKFTRRRRQQKNQQQLKKSKSKSESRPRTLDFPWTVAVVSYGSTVYTTTAAD